MVTLPGYQTHHLLYESTNSLVYRAKSLQDNRPVILKLLKDDYPSVGEVKRYRQEYDITKDLGSESVIHAYHLYPYQKKMVMVLEDFGGESLKNILRKTTLDVPFFLEIAIKISRAIATIHGANVIHKDINPSNIIFNTHTHQLKLIDFGISSRIAQAHQSIKNPDILEGTLSYISPEQTGRTNCFLDHRTDLYSLGITFYEMLTQQLPFQFQDSLELVHAHLAKEAPSPHTINPDIPPVVSDIISKLIRKKPEDRYKSASGVQSDLETCLNHIEQQGASFYFEIAQHDYTTNISIPQTLYGRTLERSLLLEAFERISMPTTTGEEVIFLGASELVLVTGYSGTGKSALVRELYRPVTQKQGYFITGKFNQLQRNIPYSAIVNAFSHLVRQLLTESPQRLEEWRTKMMTKLGKNGQVIVDIIPDIELIIGPQPTLPRLGPIETQNRFKRVFRRFVRVFSSLEHPLVIFLDDLQWADRASLQLIQLILTDPKTRSLLLIGAYRDNEVNSTHPLTASLQVLAQQGIHPTNIVLPPLTLDHLSQFLEDILSSDRSTVLPLAHLIYQKTDGNPFFFHEFIKTLADDAYLVFDVECRAWTWETDQIERLDITDNVVELMMTKLRKLPSETQRLLSLAACMGSEFDLKTLAIIGQADQSITFENLLLAVHDGLILTRSEPDEYLMIHHYAFLHDRVQQAAYELINQAEKSQVHYSIGCLWRDSIFHDYSSLDTHPWTDTCFEIVDHLNMGRSLLRSLEEQLNLARLNLKAAQKAKESTAYHAAHRYLSVGLECLPSSAWTQHYSLAYSLYYTQAEVEYFLGHFDQSKELLEKILIHAQSILDQAEVYNFLVIESTLETHYADALHYGQKALNALGIPFPKNHVDQAFEALYTRYQDAMGDRSIASLFDLPDITSPEKKLAVKILSNLGSATYRYDRTTWQVVVLTSVLLFLDHGNAPESCYAYSSLGTFLGTIIGKYQQGYEACTVAMKLSKRYHDLTQQSRACFMMSNFIQSWIKPIHLADSINQEGVQVGLESGEVQYVGYTFTYRISNLFFQGKSLPELLSVLDESWEFCQRVNNQWSIDVLQGYKYVLNDLEVGLGETNPEEATYIDHCVSRHSFSGLCRYYIAKAIALYLYNENAEVLSCIQSANKLVQYITGVISTAELKMYESLILIRLYEANQAEQTDNKALLLAGYSPTDILDIIHQNQAQLKRWADYCSYNFLHKYWIVEAELARISDRPFDAMERYDQAIAATVDTEDFMQDEALANELAATFWITRHKPEFALGHLRRARYAYEHWGAGGKVQQLDREYDAFFDAPTSRPQPQTATLTTTSNSGSTQNARLDLETLMKASQAIATDIVLDKLLANLMNVLVENAGAQVGHLLLETDGDVRIEATSFIEGDPIVLQSLPVGDRLPNSILNFVTRTHESVLLNDATEESDFSTDPYIQTYQPQSILCTPLLNQAKLVGILYLENNLTTGAFTSDRLELLTLLSAQAAISLENARLYNTLEQKVIERTQELAEEQAKSERLLRNILPESIAHRLKQDQGAIAEGFEEVTVLFSDIVGFTKLSSQISPERLVECLNQIFSVFDQLCDRHGLEKIKTIGDAYMVVGGLPEPNPNHAGAIADMALDMQKAIATIPYPLPINPEQPHPLAIRIGIHTGPVVAGVIGTKKFTYDLWGDTVNVASRMESHGIPGQIQVSAVTYQRLKANYCLQERGVLDVKGKGQMLTYWLEGTQS